MSKKKTPIETTAEVVINEHGVITAGYETIDVPTGVAGITVKIQLAEHEEKWYAGYRFKRDGSENGTCGASSPISVDAESSLETRNDALDATLKLATDWMRHSIDSYPKGAWTPKFRKALKAVEEYREALNGKKTPPADGWTCPDCGAVNDANSGECDCGTTYDGPMDDAEPTPETPALEPAESVESAKVTSGSLLKKAGPQIDPAFARDKESVPLLQGVTDTIRELLDTLDRGAAQIGLRVGICLEVAKQLVKHGEFEDWQMAVFGGDWDERHLQRFHALGKTFLQKYRHLLPNAKSDRKLLSAGDIEPETIIPPNLEGPAREFVGEKTLADLLDEHGIKKRPTGKPRGGDHGGGAAMAAKALTPEDVKREAARSEWPELISKLRGFVFTHQKLGYLDPTSLHEGRKAIEQCVDEINKLKD